MTKKKKSNKEAYKKAYKEIWKDERNEAEERQKKVIKDFKDKVFDYSELEIMVNHIDENTTSDKEFCLEFTKAIFNELGWKLFSTEKKCVICNRKIKPEPISGWEHGCNAEPVASGACCYKCDNEVVLPARMDEYFKSSPRKS